MDPMMRNRPGQGPRRGGGNQFMPMPPVQDPWKMNILPAEMPGMMPPVRGLPPGVEPAPVPPGIYGGPGRGGPYDGRLPGPGMMPPASGWGGGMPPMLNPGAAISGNLSDYIGKKGDGMGMPPMWGGGGPGMPGMPGGPPLDITNIPPDVKAEWDRQDKENQERLDNIYKNPPPGADPAEWDQFVKDMKRADEEGRNNIPVGGRGWDSGTIMTANKGATSRQMGRGLKDKERAKVTTKPKIGKQPPKVAYDSPPTKPPQMLPPQRDPLEYATGVQSKSLRDRKSDSRIKPTGTRQKG